MKKNLMRWAVWLISLHCIAFSLAFCGDAAAAGSSSHVVDQERTEYEQVKSLPVHEQAAELRKLCTADNAIALADREAYRVAITFSTHEERQAALAELTESGNLWPAAERAEYEHIRTLPAHEQAAKLRNLIDMALIYYNFLAESASDKYQAVMYNLGGEERKAALAELTEAGNPFPAAEQAEYTHSMDTHQHEQSKGLRALSQCNNLIVETCRYEYKEAMDMPDGEARQARLESLIAAGNPYPAAEEAQYASILTLDLHEQAQALRDLCPHDDDASVLDFDDEPDDEYNLYSYFGYNLLVTRYYDAYIEAASIPDKEVRQAALLTLEQAGNRFPAIERVEYAHAIGLPPHEQAERLRRLSNFNNSFARVACAAYTEAMSLPEGEGRQAALLALEQAGNPFPVAEKEGYGHALTLPKHQQGERLRRLSNFGNLFARIACVTYTEAMSIPDKEVRQAALLTLEQAGNPFPVAEKEGYGHVMTLPPQEQAKQLRILNSLDNVFASQALEEYRSVMRTQDGPECQAALESIIKDGNLWPAAEYAEYAVVMACDLHKRAKKLRHLEGVGNVFLTKARETYRAVIDIPEEEKRQALLCELTAKGNPFPVAETAEYVHLLGLPFDSSLIKRMVQNALIKKTIARTRVGVSALAFNHALRAENPCLEAARENYVKVFALDLHEQAAELRRLSRGNNIFAKISFDEYNTATNVPERDLRQAKLRTLVRAGNPWYEAEQAEFACALATSRHKQAAKLRSLYSDGNQIATNHYNLYKAAMSASDEVGRITSLSALSLVNNPFQQAELSEYMQVLALSPNERAQGLRNLCQYNNLLAIQGFKQYTSVMDMPEGERQAALEGLVKTGNLWHAAERAEYAHLRTLAPHMQVKILPESSNVLVKRDLEVYKTIITMPMGQGRQVGLERLVQAYNPWLALAEYEKRMQAAYECVKTCAPHEQAAELRKLCRDNNIFVREHYREYELIMEKPDQDGEARQQDLAELTEAGSLWPAADFEEYKHVKTLQRYEQAQKLRDLLRAGNLFVLNHRNAYSAVMKIEDEEARREHMRTIVTGGNLFPTAERIECEVAKKSSNSGTIRRLVVLGNLWAKDNK